MKFETTFPVWYRAFTQGEIALLMEQSGGICDLAIEDVEYKDGIPYPDNFQWPVFSRNGGSSGNRPLMGAGIRLLNLSDDGTVDYVTPESPEVFPWGFRSKNAAMFLWNKSVVFQIHRASRSHITLRLCVNEDYLFRGESPCIKCHRNDILGLKNSEFAGTPIDQSIPFPNGTATRTVRPGSEKENCLIFHETIHLPYGNRELYFAFYGGEHVTFTKDPVFRLLDFPWMEEKQTVVLSFASTEKEACRKAKDFWADAGRMLRMRLHGSSLCSRHAAVVNVRGKPEVADFFREQSQYLHCFLVGNEIGVRAAAYKFSYFAMWDAIFPIRDFLRNGEFYPAKRMFRYLLHYPNMQFFPWGSTHLVLMLEEILAYGEDDELFQEAWPVLKRFLAVIEKMTDPETGLYSDVMSCAVDVSAELGLEGRYYAVCMNSFYYNALRTMENFAREAGEDASGYHEAWKKLEQHFLPLFFNEKAGFVRLALDSHLKPARVEVFMNTSGIGLEFPFGEHLFAGKIPAMSRFMASKMKHPMGYSAVPYNSPLPCDMWRNVHMNQHLGHEGKLARFAGNVKEVKRILEPYLQKFRQYGTAVETYNLAGCYGDESQLANWQTFSATAAATCIISGLCGIFHHRGGYSYDPAESSDELLLEKFAIKGKRLEIRIHGTGKYAVSRFNGAPLNGTLQLPDDLPLKEKNVWEITRTNHCPEEPVLISMHGLPVSKLVSSGEALSFTAERAGSYPVKWVCGSPVQVLVNGKTVQAGKFPDLTLDSGDRVELRGHKNHGCTGTRKLHHRAITAIREGGSLSKT